MGKKETVNDVALDNMIELLKLYLISDVKYGTHQREECSDYLINNGFVDSTPDETNTGYSLEITDKGRAYINKLLSVKIPKMKWK